MTAKDRHHDSYNALRKHFCEKSKNVQKEEGWHKGVKVSTIPGRKQEQPTSDVFLPETTVSDRKISPNDGSKSVGVSSPKDKGGEGRSIDHSQKLSVSSSREVQSSVSLAELDTVDIKTMRSAIQQSRQDMQASFEAIASIFGVSTAPGSRQELFSSVLNSANSVSPLEKKTMSDLLYQYAFENRGVLAGDTETLIMLLFSSLNDSENVESMYLDFGSDSFKQVPSNRERFIQALLAQGKHEDARHYLNQFCADLLVSPNVDQTQYLGGVIIHTGGDSRAK